MNAKAEFGKEAKDALASLRKNLFKMKTEGKKIGTDQDNRQVRDVMYEFLLAQTKRAVKNNLPKVGI